jgi:hypothetical protein
MAQFRPEDSSLGIEEGRESDRVEMDMVSKSILRGYSGLIDVLSNRSQGP